MYIIFKNHHQIDIFNSIQLVQESLGERTMFALELNHEQGHFLYIGLEQKCKDLYQKIEDVIIRTFHIHTLVIEEKDGTFVLSVHPLDDVSYHV